MPPKRKPCLHCCWTALCGVRTHDPCLSVAKHWEGSILTTGLTTLLNAEMFDDVRLNWLLYIQARKEYAEKASCRENERE
jgi:hypothetical protein